MLMPNEEKSLVVRALGPVAEERRRPDPRAQKWMFALLLYNTCVAPMSTYCADNILQYGIDVAKYHFISLFFKFLREVGPFKLPLRTMLLLIVSFYRSLAPQ